MVSNHKPVYTHHTSRYIFQYSLRAYWIIIMMAIKVSISNSIFLFQRELWSEDVIMIDRLCISHVLENHRLIGCSNPHFQIEVLEFYFAFTFKLMNCNKPKDYNSSDVWFESKLKTNFFCDLKCSKTPIYFNIMQCKSKFYYLTTSFTRHLFPISIILQYTFFVARQIVIGLSCKYKVHITSHTMGNASNFDMCNSC